MNNIIAMLDQNNISGHLIMNGISCSHNLKEYIIEKEDGSFKLLEANVALNKKRKARFHEIGKLHDAKAIVEFIKTRNFYMVS